MFLSFPKAERKPWSCVPWRMLSFVSCHLWRRKWYNVGGSWVSTTRVKYVAISPTSVMLTKLWRVGHLPVTEVSQSVTKPQLALFWICRKDVAFTKLSGFTKKPDGQRLTKPSSAFDLIRIRISDDQCFSRLHRHSPTNPTQICGG